MSVFIDARIWHEGIRLDTEMTAVQSEFGVEEQDDTRFNEQTRRQATGGLKVLSVGLDGFFKAGEGEMDDQLFSDVGVEDAVISIAPNNGAVGERVYFSKFMFSSFEWGGTVGEQNEFSGGAVSQGSPLLRGVVLANELDATASGNGTVIQEGAVADGQKLYAVLHVISSDGDGSQTLDVTVESDDASGFGAPTTQITFPQVGTNEEGFWATPVDGPITDDWWRAAWTIGGTGSPSFEFAVGMAIL